jgi:hypothetical protein
LKVLARIIELLNAIADVRLCFLCLRFGGFDRFGSEPQSLETKDGIGA